MSSVLGGASHAKLIAISCSAAAGALGAGGEDRGHHPPLRAAHQRPDRPGPGLRPERDRRRRGLSRRRSSRWRRCCRSSPTRRPFASLAKVAERGAGIDHRDVPPDGVRDGEKIDCYVTSMGAATSLKGGRLVRHADAGPIPGSGIFALCRGRSRSKTRARRRSASSRAAASWKPTCRPSTSTTAGSR